MNLDDLIILLNEVFAYEPGIPIVPWSLIELDLHVTQIARINSIPPDIDEIIQEGQHGNNQFKIENLGNFSLNEVVAIAAFLAEVFAIQNRDNANQYLQSILTIEWSTDVRNSWFVNDYLQPGPTEIHKNIVSHVVHRLNLRNALHLNHNEKPWQKTYLLQCGLTKSQWSDLITESIPNEPGGAPEIAGMLHNDQQWKSESFIQTWQALYQYQEKDITRIDAESVLAASHWVPRDWIKELLDLIEFARQNNGHNEDSTQIESGCRKSPLALPKLLWDDAPVFESAILTDALIRICPPDCLALRLTGPQGALGEINRARANAPWQRVGGAGITPGLAIRISPQELGSGEVTVELRSLTPESDFFTEVALRLWHDDAIVSRFDRNGLLEIDAWNRRLPGGHSVTLTVPFGWSIAPQPSRLIELSEPGIALAQFNGDQRPITICDDSGTSWWNSHKLESPSRRIPLHLRQLKPEFIIDQTRATYVTGHIEVPIEFREMIEQVKIGTNIMTWQAARVRNAIRIGTDGFRTESLWHGLKAELRVTIQGQTHKLLRTAPARFDPATPGAVILARLPTGDVKKISDETSMGTLRQFQMTSFRAIYPRYVPHISVYQNGQMIGIISGKNAQWGVVQHLGIPFQYSYETNENQNLRVFMEGIEERGCIASVDLPENLDEARPISIRLTNSIEPSPATDAHQGHQILMLIRRKAGERWGLEALALPPDQVACLINDDWSSWQVEIPAEGDVVCAVAISYGTTIIGSWVSRRNDDIRQFLRGNDLQNLEVTLLSDCIRLFNPPLFGIGFDRDARHFFAQHRQVFDQRCTNPDPVSWDGVEIRQSIQSLTWGPLLDAINA